MFLVDLFSARQGIVLFFPCFYNLALKRLRRSTGRFIKPHRKNIATLKSFIPPLKTSEDISDVVFAFLLRGALNRLLKEVTTGKRKGLPGD